MPTISHHCRIANAQVWLLVSLVLAVCLLLSACAAPSSPPAAAQQPEAGSVVISFDFQRQSGAASNQFAVWIEDAEGSFVTTLYATRFTAKGGYKTRPDSIKVWAERSDITQTTSVDAITGATPGSGTLTYVWMLTDTDGKLVPHGTYRFFVEGTLRWKNYVLYSGDIQVGGPAGTVVANGAFHYEEAPGQPALTDQSSENGMIGTVKAIFTPTK